MNRLIGLFFCLISLLTVYSQVSPAIKITAATRIPGDHFGNSVAIDGSYAVVGVCNLYSTSVAGSAIIFEQDAGGNWNQIQILAPSDLQPGDRFGSFTAISGNYIVVSAPAADSVGQDSTITAAGAVYVYERNPGGVWKQVAKVRASDARSNDRFGDVALSGKYLAVGSYNDYDVNGTNYKSSAGAVYVFERTDGGEWLPVQKLTASDRASEDSFNKVAVDGYTKTIVVGAPRSSTDVSGANPVLYAGAVYVFKRDASGNWNETQKLTASARHQQAYFGTSVDVSGSWILVGADNEHYNENEIYDGNKEGAAYLFEENGAGSWLQKQKILAHDGFNGDEFGRAVSLEGNYALIGSAGISDENGGNFMGYAGCAYLYERNGATWSLKKKLVAPDRSVFAEFGWSVAISGAQIIIGAVHEDQDPGGGLEYGAANIFKILNPLGTEENDLSSINIYPNPTDGKLTISCNKTFASLTLMDMTGKILNETAVSNPDMVSYSIDQPAGIYFLKITAGNSSVIKKILVR